MKIIIFFNNNQFFEIKHGNVKHLQINKSEYIDGSTTEACISVCDVTDFLIYRIF